MDFIRDDDLTVIAAPADFLGVNYYETKTVAHDPGEPYRQARVLPAAGRLTAGDPEGGVDDTERVHRP